MRGSAFVTDGDQRATLAVVRALGGAGIAVTVGSTQATSLAGSSRYCSKQVRYPSPSQDGSSFQEFLSDELNRVFRTFGGMAAGFQDPFNTLTASRICGKNITSVRHEFLSR